MMMRKYIYLFIAFAAFLVAYLVITQSVDSNPWLRSANNGYRDSFFRLRHFSFGAPKETQQIVIVGVDESSCDKLGLRWPWPRTYFATIIDRLSTANAREIALNLSFTGSESRLDQSTRALAQAIHKSARVVVGATFGGQSRLIKPNEQLLEAGVRYGYLEKIIDDDGYIRSSYLLRLYKNQSGDVGLDSISSFEKSFPLAVLSVDAGLDGEPQYNQDLSLLTVGRPSIGVYLKADGSHVINYMAMPKDFTVLSAAAVYEGRFDPALVAGKTVMLGITSPLFGDFHLTPFGSIAGIFIHANEWLSLKLTRPLRIVSPFLINFLLMLAGLCLIAITLMTRYWIGSILYLVFAFLFLIGAQLLFSKDYLFEPLNLVIALSLSFVCASIANAAKLFFEKRALETKVIHDKMTGLYNYDYLRFRLDDEWKACKKLRTPVTVVMTDLDRFKKINDTLGHEVGNDMIRKAGEVIKKTSRGYDVVSRYGGDEFVIMLWRTNNRDGEEFKKRLRDNYHSMASKLRPELQDSSISIGVATYDPSEQDAKNPASVQALIEEADKNLFEDKESRRKPGEARR